MEATSGADLRRELGPVLIANRGEIAVRVERTLRELGLVAIAVFTEADRRSPHARGADLAVGVGSYLDPGELIEAAERAGAGAVHPGYGFLSENPSFARAVGDAGLVWVGPPPEAIELMGDKARSKTLAAESGVPVVPGTTGEDASPEDVADFAAEHGYPLLIKAVAGGGGKGMRIVASEEELGTAYPAARREAEAAFADARVLAERLIERPRHIEIQVLADRHGSVRHLGERECSLQRRHQKVVEEAPSPLIDVAMRERMGSAAVELARACGYVGAGTVEFVLPADGESFHFIEMNTRLQVEHPVTELVWGLDLVEQQLRVAAGERLAADLGNGGPRGHAVEARLYAESPSAGFLPSTGVVRRWRPPELAGVRVDAGVEEGSVIGSEYDPMIAKVIAHGPDRYAALARLDRALGELQLLGVSSSAAFSRSLLARPEVVEGRMDTTLLERVLEDDELELEPPPDLAAAAAAAWFAADTADLTVPPGPWVRSFEDLGEVEIEAGEIAIEGRRLPIRIESLGEREIRVELEGFARNYCVAYGEGRIWVGRAGHQLELVAASRGAAGAGAGAGSLEAPMPGKVLSVEVREGQPVEEGELLMVLESMKMELAITAPSAGVVSELDLAPGDQVGQGESLLALVAAEAEAEPR